jgi:hypothetical protein
MTIESEFREPTAQEQALLNRLLEAEFPGRNELEPLLRRVFVKTIDEDGGLELQSQIEGTAPVVKRVPVEAEGRDEDGVMIHMELHVVNGRPIELEFYREDTQTVKKIPPPSAFEVIVLPPMPDKGWGQPAPR